MRLHLLAVLASCFAWQAWALTLASSARVFTTDHDGKVTFSGSVAKDSKKTLKFKLEHSQELHVAVDLAKVVGEESFKAPQQAFLRLKHEATGMNSYIAGSVKSNGTVQWKTTSAHVAKQIGTFGGDFAATILLGDYEEPGIRVDLGTVSLLHTPLPSGAQPAEPATQAVVAAAQLKPEIVHMHRQPDKRPPIIIALVFTGLALLPLAVLIGALNTMGVNMKLFTGSVATTGLLFHGSLISMLVLYSLFWVKLNLLQTLPWVAILGGLTAVTGYFHLNAVSLARNKAAAKSDKSD